MRMIFLCGSACRYKRAVLVCIMIFQCRLSTLIERWLHEVPLYLPSTPSESLLVPIEIAASSFPLLPSLPPSKSLPFSLPPSLAPSKPLSSSFLPTCQFLRRRFAEA